MISEKGELACLISMWRIVCHGSGKSFSISGWLSVDSDKSNEQSALSTSPPKRPTYLVSLSSEFTGFCWFITVITLVSNFINSSFLADLNVQNCFNKINKEEARNLLKLTFINLLTLMAGYRKLVFQKKLITTLAFRKFFQSSW